MRRIAIAVILTAAGLFFYGSAAPLTHAGELTVRLDQRFAVGDRVYDGGLVTVRPYQRGMMALQVDGQQVGLLHRYDSGLETIGAQPRLAFEQDDNGMLHLDSIRYRDPFGTLCRNIDLEVSAVGSRQPDRHRNRLNRDRR